MQTHERTFVTSNSIHWTEAADRVILADLKNEMIFALCDVALRVWRGLIRGRTVDEIARAVAHEYDATEERIRGDIEQFVERLLDMGWLTEGGAIAGER
jgi:hypothetical protein